MPEYFKSGRYLIGPAKYACASSTSILIDDFESKCNYKELLDEGPLDEETLEEYVSGDPDVYFAKSYWGTQLCYYMMYAGFEFIFL